MSTILTMIFILGTLGGGLILLLILALRQK